MIPSTFRGGIIYPFECKHQAPPCTECERDKKIWDQFDPTRGSLGKLDQRSERDILLSIESLLQKIVCGK